MDMMSPKDIYTEVLKETDAVLHALRVSSKNAELFSAIEIAQSNFAQLKKETDQTLLELDKNAEWNVLTVALYGETNAGKSTIIETLRILLGEKTKLEQQNKFCQIREKLNVDESFVERWKEQKREIGQNEEKLKSVTTQFVESQAERKTYENEIISHIEQLSLRTKDLPFWRRILSFVWKISEKEKLKTCDEELSTYNAETHRRLQEHEREKSEITAKIDSEKKKVAAIDIAMKELETHQDGIIIGDGQSDFTRELTGYEFTANGNKFVLIDVPGIEGKEDLVREPIMQAVRKAHAVFYVTRKADPPQKGDEKAGVKGTLEKIKEHLGAQTVVWTIFNKSIKSAEQLNTPQLVNEGELESLKVLEDEMRQHFGENYSGLLNVSAYPAFIASTDHFLPGSAKSKDRSKFLSVMNSAGILQKTGVQFLAEKIGFEIAKNSKEKIRKSNFNKANDAVIQLKERVSNLNKTHFKPLFNSLQDQARDSILQLESAVDSLKNNFESSVRSLIKKKRDNIRNIMYSKIKDGIDNDDLKDFLNDYINTGIEELVKELPREFEKQAEIFQDEAKETADQFQEHIHEFIYDASKTVDMDFNLNIKIGNGINVAELLSTGIGAIVSIFTTKGFALLLGAVGFLVTSFKAIWSFFDEDYKKAQQRNAINEKINGIFRSVKSDFLSQLEKNMQKLEDNLAHIKIKFRLPAQQTEQISSSLEDSARRLELVSMKIITEGAL